jgi:hypothetical protein
MKYQIQVGSLTEFEKECEEDQENDYSSSVFDPK